MNGWIKLYRKIIENPIVTKDADHLAIWVYLLLNATYDSYPALFKGEKIVLKPGQLLTGCVSISSRLCINESKVRRVLKSFESDGQIDRQTSNKNSLISIVNWDFYQGSDGQNDTLLTDKRQASDGQMTDKRRTSDNKQECKNNKNVKEGKNGRSSRETASQLLERLIAGFSISEPLAEKMKEWITYKSERKQSYKETGLKTLLGQVATKEQEYGSIAVMNLIDDCMARNYSGIIWDRLKQTNNGKQDFVDMWRDA